MVRESGTIISVASVDASSGATQRERIRSQVPAERVFQGEDPIDIGVRQF